MDRAVSHLLPTARCPECREEFTQIPRPGRPLPRACKDCIRTYNGKQRRGLVTDSLRKATVAKKQIARQRLQQRLRTQFGSLSERDAALFSAGMQAGYSRGYDAGYHLKHRKVAS